MVFILSYAPTPPPPPPILLFPVETNWTGWDGSVWNLQSGSEGVALLQDGVVGLHNPRMDRYLSSNRAVPGNRVRGSRTQARPVVWPLLIHAHTSEDWLTADKGFWRTMHPEKEGVWRVRVGTQVRELRCAAIFQSDHSYRLDPYKGGWATYVAELEAHQPYWTGPIEKQRFEIGVGTVDFFDAGGSPPFHISPGSTFATAAVNNPGDVDAYPVWTVVGGPLTNVQLGVGAVTVNVPFTIDAGEVLRIDTDPRNQTATLDGVDVGTTLGFQSFASIERGMAMPLTVAASGSVGYVEIELTPLYLRAF